MELFFIILIGLFISAFILSLLFMNSNGENPSIRKIVSITLLCCLGVFGITYLLDSYNLKTGDHSGYITAVEQNRTGYQFYVKTDLSSSQEDKYCARPETDSTTIEKLKTAQIEKKSLTIHYQEHINFLTFNCKDEITIK